MGLHLELLLLTSGKILCSTYLIQRLGLVSNYELILVFDYLLCSFRMNSESLKSPLCLKTVRKYFERNFCGKDFHETDVPVSSYVMGIVTGYRLVRTDYDSTQVCLDLSQGSNEEFRLQYIGEFSN